MAETSVPKPALTATGFVPPTEQAILEGRKADFNQAFGADLNFGSVINPSPQGQLVATETAIIGAANDAFAALANGVDPAFASGRMQDAIARIYFLQRKPGESTTVQCTCTGLAGTLIPPNSLAINADGNIYFAVSGGIIPLSGNVEVTFACQTVGPIPCPADTLNKIYRTVPGWDTINNAQDGIIGSNVESRMEFEARRQASVALNSVGFIDSVLGSVLNVPGVLDAYVTDNTESYLVAVTPSAVVSASIAGTALTIVGILAGEVMIGQTVTGMLGGVSAGTVITANIDPTHWTVNNSQTVSQITMNLGGVLLGPHALYVGVVGGDETAVATAIWTKKSPGCPYFDGNATVTVYDANAQYPPPGVPYTVKYNICSPLEFVVQVNIADSPSVPGNADALIQAAVISAFGGADGGRRVTIGSTVYANRFYRAINALGDWAEIVSLFLGTKNNPSAVLTGSMGATFTGSGSATNLTVSGSSGYISDGDAVTGSGIPAGTTIITQSSGTTGGDGIYITNNATTASGACTSTSDVLNVTTVISGALAVGQFMFDDDGDVDSGTEILALVTGTGGTGTYRTDAVQRFASEQMYSVVPNRTVVGTRIDQAPTVSAATIQVNLI